MITGTGDPDLSECLVYLSAWLEAEVVTLCIPVQTVGIPLSPELLQARPSMQVSDTTQLVCR